jgi:NADH-quinone oxidoreductase subunit G
LATLYIDNKPYEVNSGKNLLEVCLSLGMNLPYFCWHPALGSVGACRQCAIKIFKDEDDKKGRLIMSCMEPVTNNQRISITDFEANEFREHVIGWLMTNHPHDCAVCDEGGSCHLQDMTVMTGHAYRKFNFKKRTYQNQYLGPFINHEMNRCIQCYRCVRFYRDYAGGRDLDAFASRNKVYFGRQQDGVLENEFSGNLTEVCPTGVFTDKTLKQHYTRKWDLTMAPSVCNHCSLGCNIIAGERYGSLRMIANRYHEEVNGYFICDRGRFGYEFVNSPSRIRKAVIKTKSVSVDEGINEVATQFKAGKVIGIGSARACMESNYVLQKLVGENNFYSGVSERAFELNYLVKNVLMSGSVKSLSMQEVGNADAVFILGEDLTNTAPMMALAVRQAVKQEPLKKISKVGIPEWNDAAARGYIQDEKGPLFIASVVSTKLDDVATRTWNDAPENIARIGFMVAHYVDASQPSVSGLSSDEIKLAREIADSLLKAERPAIISGTSSASSSMIKAASNIAHALSKKNSKAGLVLTLLVDGQPVRACVLPLAAVAGKPVHTIEGAAARKPYAAVRAAWIAEQVPQCGYCQSGMVMATIALLEQQPAPSDADIDAAITNICRCGTYSRIRKAIHRAAAVLAKGTP